MPNQNTETTSEQHAQKKRRQDRGNETEDDGYESSVPEDSDSDEGLGFEERVSRAKKRKAARKQEKVVRDRNVLVGNLAAGHTTPAAATALSRALHEWLRFMLGMTRKSKNSQDTTMPTSPTDEERRQWMNRQSTREVLITKAIEKALRKYNAKMTNKDKKFKANSTQIRAVEKDAAAEAMSNNPLRPVTFTSQISFTSRPKYSHLWGSKCEGALALAGFPRCTLDWEAGYDTPWNSAMTSILIQQWVMCFEGNGAKGFGITTAENTAENREEIVRRWVINQLGKYRKQCERVELAKNPEGQQQVKDHDAITRSKESRRRALDKIYEARKKVVERIFGGDSPEAQVVSYREVHSEDEVKSSTNSATRNKVHKEWRSAELDTFISLVDECLWRGERIPKKIRAAKLIVERGTYSTTPDPECYPPKGFQRSLVSPAWLSKTSRLTVLTLDLVNTDTLNIETAVSEVTKLLQCEGGSGSTGV